MPVQKGRLGLHRLAWTGQAVLLSGEWAVCNCTGALHICALLCWGCPQHARAFGWHLPCKRVQHSMHWPMDSQGAFSAPICHAQQLGPLLMIQQRAHVLCLLGALCGVHGRLLHDVCSADRLSLLCTGPWAVQVHSWIRNLVCKMTIITTVHTQARNQVQSGVRTAILLRESQSQHTSHITPVCSLSAWCLGNHAVSCLVQ